VVKDILNFLLEAAEEEGEFKDVFGSVQQEPEYSLAQIKAATAGFFSRKNTKTFGTREIHKYRGNYVVLHNVKETRGAYAFAAPRKTDDWVIYKFKRTEDQPEGDLFYVVHARDLDDAKYMIKTGHFENWHYKRLGLLPEAARFNGDIDQILEAVEGEEFKDVFTPDIREIQVFGKRWWRRGYGGEYNTARIYVNDQHVATLGENGGGGDQYLWRAQGWLYDHGYIGDRRTSLRIYCEQHGIKLINDVTDVRRERDLDRPMNEDEEADEYKEIHHTPWTYKVLPETEGPEPWKVIILHFDSQVGAHYVEEETEAHAVGQTVVQACRKLDEVHPYDQSRWRYNAIWNWLIEHGIEI